MTFFVDNGGVLSAQRNVFDERDAIKLKAVVALHLEHNSHFFVSKCSEFRSIAGHGLKLAEEAENQVRELLISRDLPPSRLGGETHSAEKKQSTLRFLAEPVGNKILVLRA